MKQTILARRYAKAVFSIGADSGKYGEYNDALQAVANLYMTNPDVVDALTNPLYPLELREKVMVGIVKSMDIDAVMSNFLNLLVEKKRAEILPEIAEEFQAMVDDAQNLSHGSVISAVELSEELQGKIQQTLEKLTGKKVELTTSVDPSIIGGIVAKVGDLVLDGSIKTQLAGLKESIKGRE
ncbi:F0F1 ATP synthase subunit delta [Desulfotalea psychrophila]|uniref:ATP synthase subunit delta n=1 Tax=Desulfotalea psychrophila (strain LSv54 / DSM 12343) TaxID=177439 RepID=ATPD_DESPS|nr:F0F1 ATP synthase subunit delta [Desulfotalea psychrophila]Q6AQ13.1 RecName: Full=ATP synthase subunit delta; AltName: Full=ATP synthase F(1) sector subunit delta; AltName: Full=F-type ATPase subunit delta; Short=F-ATPase subunit delta [Desulfotalea psychrophila LSv54]CAG35560.1 probable ATP synthase, delta subunit (AtpD) [Desulfotalea psychrophila LSv54]